MPLHATKARRCWSHFWNSFAQLLTREVGQTTTIFFTCVWRRMKYFGIAFLPAARAEEEEEEEVVVEEDDEEDDEDEEEVGEKGVAAEEEDALPLSLPAPSPPPVDDSPLAILTSPSLSASGGGMFCFCFFGCGFGEGPLVLPPLLSIVSGRPGLALTSTFVSNSPAMSKV